MVYITLIDMHTITRKEVVKSRLRIAAIDWDCHGLVILVTILIGHHDDFAQTGIDIECLTREQVWVVQGDIRREQRLRHAAAIIHSIQADVTTKIALKIDSLADLLRA
jgi:hypothetical protein